MAGPPDRGGHVRAEPRGGCVRDAQVAPFAHRIGIAAVERLIAEAVARFMPDRAAEDARRGGGPAALHHRPPAGLLRRHQPGHRRARPRRRPRPRRSRLKGCRGASGAGVDGLPRRTPLDRRRPARPPPARPRPRDRSDEAAATTRVVEQRADRGDHRPGRRTDAASGGAARAPHRDRHHREQRVVGAGAGGEPATARHRRPGPQLVRQPRRRGGREAGDRSQRTHPRRRLRSPRPPPGTVSRARSHVRVSPGAPDQPERWMPTMSSPTPRVAPRPATTSHHCADDIIG